MKVAEMFGYVFTVDHAVVALIGVATAMGAYGFYEFYRRFKPHKEKVDVSDVIDRHLGNDREYQCGDYEKRVDMPFATKSLKSDSPTSSQQYAQAFDINKELNTRDSSAYKAETFNAEVFNGLLNDINLDCLSEGFRELMENRVAALRSAVNDGDGCGVKAVDLYEELQRLMDSSDDGERLILDSILSRIASALKFNGFTVINLTDWNPELQNAAVVTQGECAEGIKIIANIASGVKRNGRILRKQEVSILTSKKEY